MFKSVNYRQSGDGACHRSDPDRYFRHDRDWYFSTREGVTMGPYQSRAKAIAETGTYITFVRAANKPLLNLIRRRKATLSRDD